MFKLPNIFGGSSTRGSVEPSHLGLDETSPFVSAEGLSVEHIQSQQRSDAYMEDDGQAPAVPTRPQRSDRVNIRDWSGTGQGSHVEFESRSTLPFQQGKHSLPLCKITLINGTEGQYLGQGVTGPVHEIVIQGCRLAHKRIVIRHRKIGPKERKEVEIMKKLASHSHMLQLVGTYTHKQFLGILMFPVAVCDLHAFFEDVEAWSSLHAEKDTRSTTRGSRGISQRSPGCSRLRLSASG
jgi:hypothetical protein